MLKRKRLRHKEPVVIVMERAFFFELLHITQTSILIFSSVFKIPQYLDFVKRIHKKSKRKKCFLYCGNLFFVFPAIFARSHPISLFKSTYKMLRTVVADKFTDGMITEGGFAQSATCLSQLDITNDLQKRLPGTFL